MLLFLLVSREIQGQYIRSLACYILSVVSRTTRLKI